MLICRPLKGIYEYLNLDNVKYSINLAEKTPRRVSAVSNGNFKKIYEFRILLVTEKHAAFWFPDP